jgi:3-hydroxybutyryl-CoA dehydratase
MSAELSSPNRNKPERPCPSRFEFTRSFTSNDVLAFYALSKDENSINHDVPKTTVCQPNSFRLPGLLSATMFSALFGSVFPGIGTLYRMQTLRFLGPMFPGREYVAVATLVRRWPSKNVAVFSTSIMEVGSTTVVLEGRAIILHREKL